MRQMGVIGAEAQFLFIKMKKFFQKILGNVTYTMISSLFLSFLPFLP